MARCAFHPETETNLRCAECDRYICAKDMVTTPVGYKCRECARPAPGQLGGIKPRQYGLAVLASLGAGAGGGILLGGLIGRTPILLTLFFGMLVGEATRRGSGGHRMPAIAAVAVAGAAFGALAGGFSLIGVVLAGVAAAFTVLGNRF